MTLWIPLPVSCLPFEGGKWTINIISGRYLELSLCNRQVCIMISDWISIFIKGSGFGVVLGFLLFIGSGDCRGFVRWSLQHRILTQFWGTTDVRLTRQRSTLYVQAMISSVLCVACVIVFCRVVARSHIYTDYDHLNTGFVGWNPTGKSDVCPQFVLPWVGRDLAFGWPLSPLGLRSPNW
jgi:hypothetical protein